MQIPFAMSIFCDDIRYEMHGKHSLIGIYRDDMVLSAPFPAMLPKLAVSVMLFEHPSQPAAPTEVRIYLPGDKDDTPFFKTMVEYQPELHHDAPANRRRMLNLHFVLANVPLREAGRIKVRLYRADMKIRAGTLLVRSAPPESLALRPVEAA